MRAVVFAYSNIGDRCLRVLCARGVDVVLVVTHHDRPGETIWFHRVADTAAELDLDFVHADDPNAPDLIARVAHASPDVIFAFYYRRLLPQAILGMASKGAFNMHGSLLPRYRGRAPTNWAVLNGETQTGATLHEMIAEPDAGAIVDQSAVPILPDDTGLQVMDKVTVAAEQVLWRSLPAIMSGHAPRRPNDLSMGSWYGARTPEDGRIDWSQPAARVYDLIRAVAPPYPGAYVEQGKRRLVIASARRLAGARRVDLGSVAPGLHVVAERIVGVCGDRGQIEVCRLLVAGVPVDPGALRVLLRSHAGEATS